MDIKNMAATKSSGAIIPINPRINSYFKSKSDKSDNLSLVYIIAEGKFFKKK